MNRKAAGAYYEAIVANYFRHLGFAIFARNLRTRFGEIDLLIHKGEETLLIEVRGRKCDGYAPHLYLSSRKIRRLHQLGSWACIHFRRKIRIELVEVIGTARSNWVARLAGRFPEKFGIQLKRFPIS